MTPFLNNLIMVLTGVVLGFLGTIVTAFACHKDEKKKTFALKREEREFAAELLVIGEHIPSAHDVEDIVVEVYFKKGDRT